MSTPEFTPPPPPPTRVCLSYTGEVQQPPNFIPYGAQIARWVTQIKFKNGVRWPFAGIVMALSVEIWLSVSGTWGF